MGGGDNFNVVGTSLEYKVQKVRTNGTKVRGTKSIDIVKKVAIQLFISFKATFSRNLLGMDFTLC